MLTGLLSCLRSEPRHPLGALTEAQADDAILYVTWPGGGLLVDDPRTLLANREAFTVRHGRLNFAGSAASKYKVYLYVGDELVVDEHAYADRHVDFGTLRSASTPAEFVVAQQAREAYVATLARVAADPRARLLGEHADPAEVAAQRFDLEFGLRLPALPLAVPPDEAGALARAAEVQRAIRERLLAALDVPRDSFRLVEPEPAELLLTRPPLYDPGVLDPASPEPGSGHDVIWREEPTYIYDAADEPVRLERHAVFSPGFQFHGGPEAHAALAAVDAEALHAGLADSTSLAEEIALRVEGLRFDADRTARLIPDGMRANSLLLRRTEPRTRTWPVAYLQPVGEEGSSR